LFSRLTYFIIEPVGLFLFFDTPLEFWCMFIQNFKNFIGLLKIYYHQNVLDLTRLTCGNPTLSYEQNEIIFKHVNI